MLSKQLTDVIASEILNAVNDNGWRTQITSDAGFNRSRFNGEYIKRLALSQMLRLMVAIAYKKGKGFITWWCNLGEVIRRIAEDSEAYYAFTDEPKGHKPS